MGNQIRNNRNIKGMFINGVEHKIKQFADDCIYVWYSIYIHTYRVDKGIFIMFGAEAKRRKVTDSHLRALEESI